MTFFDKLFKIEFSNWGGVQDVCLPSDSTRIGVFRFSGGLGDVF